VRVDLQPSDVRDAGRARAPAGDPAAVERLRRRGVIARALTVRSRLPRRKPRTAVLLLQFYQTQMHLLLQHTHLLL
jgi:hypothetical protein